MVSLFNKSFFSPPTKETKYKHILLQRCLTVMENLKTEECALICQGDLS